MRLVRLTTVDAFVAFDLDDCETNAGGTRFAPDVTEHEVKLLARAMTYKYAALGLRMGGAKGAVRGEAAERESLMRRYCDEIRPLSETMRFLTGPDLGTFETDFATLRPTGNAFSAMTTAMDGIPFEDIVTGFGVVAAAETALGSLAGTTFAIEGFGKVGGGVAREAVRRGARVTAISTIEGLV
ncbi:MAG: Glu/Leu/Phe/Val dehydrogenase dimerization domain-containing protein, partial [Candidatus Binatia bacterium]